MTTYTETGRMEGESGLTTSTKKADAKYPPSKDRVSANRSGSKKGQQTCSGVIVFVTTVPTKTALRGNTDSPFPGPADNTGRD